MTVWEWLVSAAAGWSSNWVYDIDTQKNGYFTQTLYTFLKQ